MVIHGDSLEVLKTLDANSVDAVVTDPPYGLSFMGKKWDYSVPSVELWREVFRVLKPGGHLLSFGGTRTYHRMVVAIEDAGFEIRDQVQWIYGSGFPKSLDVSKAIDKQAGAEREVIGRYEFPDGGNRIKDRTASERVGQLHGHKHTPITCPATDSAKQWQGWGTALKPATEIICMARKPLSESTVAKNVLKWGCGALNIDESRIAGPKGVPGQLAKHRKGEESQGWCENQGEHAWKRGMKRDPVIMEEVMAKGRWPANVLFDESAAEMLDEQSGVSKSQVRKISSTEDTAIKNQIYGKGYVRQEGGQSDSGGASRFFYVAKASKRERNAGLEGMPEKPMNTYNFSEDGSFTKNSTAKSGEQVRDSRQNFHPTVKPIRLMEYLCKLITPPSGVILDPFCGSGSTGVAATKLGFKFVGIEREAEYVEIANKRIENVSIEEQLDLV